MSEKELLCVALVTENGERYDAEIYQDGTFLAKDGSFQRLSELEFEHAKVLTRRAEREKKLVQVANDIMPYRKGDMPPDEYAENLAPYTEEDFLLPEERKLPEDMVTPDNESGKIVSPKADDQKDAKTPVPESADEPHGVDTENISEGNKLSEKEQKSIDAQKKELAKKAKKERKKKERAATKAEKASTSSNADVAQSGAKEIYVDEDAAKKMMESPKPKKIPIIPIIIIAVLLCAAGFYFGYASGGLKLDMLPWFGNGVDVVQPYEPTPGPLETASPEPTVEPTPAPPKTEINLIIDATDGAQVSGSTDVGTNESEAAVDATPTPEEQDNSISNAPEE